jgi:hypothetical protein
MINSKIWVAGFTGDGTPITHIIINDHHYYIELGILFIKDSKYNFKWLTDGGIVIWIWNNDCDAALELRFLPENASVIQTLKTLLFEKEVLDV